MAKIVDILATERDRQTTDAFNVVHMYKTGQFYTAYDWSAWIISVISHSSSYNIKRELFEDIDGDWLLTA
jgi:hypothetical protein